MSTVLGPPRSAPAGDSPTRRAEARSALLHRIKGAAPTLAPAVHRIISESLTNMQRRAQEVTFIDVAVFRSGDHLVVTVYNDGLAVVPKGHDTFGIVGMRERAVSLGGWLSAGPAPGGGWVVHAELPMEHPL